MASVHTHQELLYALARSGDPSAFYTLVAQFANAAYIAERNSGHSHKEALSVLIPFMKKAYQNFISNVYQQPFDVWYRDYKKKYFHSTLNRASSSASAVDVDFESIPIADISHFGAMLDLVLQRQYSKFRRTKKLRIFQQVAIQFIQLHWVLKAAFAVALAGGVVVAALGVLGLSKNKVILTYQSNGSVHSVALPFFIFDQNAANSNSRYPEPKDSLSVVTHDTLRIHDTVRNTPRYSQNTRLHSSSSTGYNGSAGASMTATTSPTQPSNLSSPSTASMLKPVQNSKQFSPSQPATASPISKPPVQPTPTPSVKSAYDSLQ